MERRGPRLLRRHHPHRPRHGPAEPQPRCSRASSSSVVADAPQQIERKVGELVDWLVAADLRQWQAVTTHLAERRRQYRDRIVGDDAGTVSLRSHAVDRLGRAARRSGSSTRTTAARGAASWPTTPATPSRRPPRPARARWASARSSRSPRRPPPPTSPGSCWRRWSPRSGSSSCRPSGRRRRRRCARKIADVRQRLSEALQEAVRPGDPAQRRPHPREHRPLQPVHPRRRGQAEGSRAGAARDRRLARQPARADRAAGGVIE